MRRNYIPSEDVNLFKRQLDKVSTEKEKLHEENNSLKIRIAGVETLSKLLQKSQEENASLRAELSRPKHQILQQSTRPKTFSSGEYGHTSPSVENLAKENTRSRREFEPDKRKQTDRLYTLREMKNTSTGKRSSTMSQLMEFKNQVVDELRRLQQSERTGQKEELLAMTAQLMDEVKLLEESMQSEECLDLKPQGKSENEKQKLRDLSENICGLGKHQHMEIKDKTGGCIASNTSLQHSTRTHCSDTIAKRNVLIPAQAALEKRTTTSETSESVELLSQSGEETGTEWSGEFIGENIGLAQGDQTSVKSVSEYICEDVGPAHKLKLTRQLLTEANEKITNLTNANGVLTDMNVNWQEYNDQRDVFVKHLENQLSQAAEQTKNLQRSARENNHGGSTGRDSQVQEQAELRHKLEAESQARTRAETTVRHLTNRLSDMMRQLELEKVKVSGLEEVVQQMTNWRNVETDDKERIKVLEEQIILCKEDFEGERADRERLHRDKENTQVRLLQMEEKANFLEHQNLAYQRELEQIHSQMAVYHLEARPSVRQLSHQRSRLGYGSSPCLYTGGWSRAVEGVIPRGKTTLPHDVEIDGDVTDGPAGSACNREMSSKQCTVQEDSIDNSGLRDNFESFASPDSVRKPRESASI